MFSIFTAAHFYNISRRALISTADCYHLADVQSRAVRLPADGPQKAVHLLDGSDLLLFVLLLRVFGGDRHLQPFVRFTHRLHLRVLPQIHSGVLHFFGAVCAYQAVKVPQNLQRCTHFRYHMAEHVRTWQSNISVWSLCDSHSRLSNDEGCFRPQGGKDACHLHCNITCTHNHTAPVWENRTFTYSHTTRHAVNIKESKSWAYFGRVSSSKKPSLVMPRLAPEMIKKHNILLNYFIKVNKQWRWLSSECCMSHLELHRHTEQKAALQWRWGCEALYTSFHWPRQWVQGRW